jgi:hypothetical protein
MKTESISISVITDSNKLDEIEHNWNRFVKNHSENPFFLSGFIRRFMEFYRSHGWVPCVLSVAVSGEVIGVAPLMTKRRFGVRFAKFLLTAGFSPDILVDDQYRELCITKIFDFMFNILHCQLVYLTLPGESPNLKFLERKRHGMRIQFSTVPAIGHYVLPINHDWHGFEKSRGKKFRQDLRRTERNLDRIGSWKVIHIEEIGKEGHAIDRILEVEKRSWKERWRTGEEAEADPVLMMVWEGSKHMSSIEPDLRPSVWFLELNDQSLAYALVIEYKETAYFAKTSYDERYRRFSPGIYVLNTAIRELFNERTTTKIDFHTALPFVRTWTSLRLTRVRIMIPQGKLLLAILFSILSTKPMNNLLSLLSTRVPSITDFAG